MPTNEEERAYQRLRWMSLCWIAAGVLVFALGGFNGKFIGVALVLYGALNHTIDAFALLVSETQADTLARLDRIENELSGRSNVGRQPEPEASDRVLSGNEPSKASELVEVLTSKAFANFAVTMPDTFSVYSEILAAGAEDPITEAATKRSGKFTYELLSKIAKRAGVPPPTNLEGAIAFARAVSVGYDSPEATERADRAHADVIKDLLRRSTKQW